MSERPPPEVSLLQTRLETEIGLDLYAIRGRAGTFNWFFSTLPENEVMLREYRWLLPKREIKVAKALKMHHGFNARYLVFHKGSNLTEKVVEIDGRKVVLLDLEKLKEAVDIVLLNPFLLHVSKQGEKIGVSLDPEYIKELESRPKDLPKESIMSEYSHKPASHISSTKPVLETIPTSPEDYQEREISKGFLVKRTELAELFKNSDTKMKIDILNTLFSELIASKDISYKDIQNFQKELPKLILQRERLEQHLTELSKFEDVVKLPQTTEEDLQQFLKKNPWVFGEEYSDVLDEKENIGTVSDVYRPDFVLKDIARKGDAVIFPDIIELKQATAKISKIDTHKKDEFAPSSPVLDAIWQGFGYVETRMKKGIYSKVFIVMGMHMGDKQKQKVLQKLNFHLPNIQLVTYDQLLQRAKIRIKYYLAEKR